MISTLKANPIWQSVTQTLAQIDFNQIAQQHLQSCKAEINGYWDEDDQFYETIRFTQSPTPHLISSSIGITQNQTDHSYWLQLRYLLTVSTRAPNTEHEQSIISSVGELSLVLDDGLTVIDENWVVNVRSPHVVAVGNHFVK